ncbi:MAG TPA: hypothetical protein VNT31_14410 [Nocardioides sp.]|nr:hypothetical protein [Nocardioides sp.]
MSTTATMIWFISTALVLAVLLGVGIPYISGAMTREPRPLAPDDATDGVDADDAEVHTPHRFRRHHRHHGHHDHAA